MMNSNTQVASSVHSSNVTILCCMCGIEIQTNPSNMCVHCIRDNIDITEGIHKHLTLHSCRGCGKFLCPPWQSIELESKELLSLCLKKIPGLSKVKLIDAVWIWTEPHSMRLKVKITVQKEVMNGAILQQAAVIFYTICNQQCKNCEASYATGAWHAVVQVRQRVSHKRTFFFLEQLLLKYNAHSECINIVTFRDGMDFYFKERNQATRFIDFLNSKVPTKSKYSRKLISADHSSNIGEFKHNFIIDIAPICKDDLLILPNDLARNVSNISQLVLVKRIGAGIHIVDPITGEKNEINSEKYWRYEFLSVMNSRHLMKYIVLSVEPMLRSNRPSAKQKGGYDRRSYLAECVVARERDFGMNDTQFTCVTHIGHILREGDTVLGYDLTDTNWNVDEQKIGKIKIDESSYPDAILVRKFYATKGDRIWKLKNLQVNEQVKLTEREQIEMEEDYEVFLQEVEGDKEMRTQMNLFKKSENVANVVGEGKVKKDVKGKTKLKLKKVMVNGGVQGESGRKRQSKRKNLDENVVDGIEEEGNPVMKEEMKERKQIDKMENEDVFNNDEEIQLDELLDDMKLIEDNEMQDSFDVAESDLSNSAPFDSKILTPEEAAAVPSIQITE